MNATSSPSVPPHRKPRICVLTFSRVSQLVESVAADYADAMQLVVEHRRFGDAVAQAQALIERGEVDVFISAGANGALLRRRLDYPVVLLKVSGFDIMGALVRAARVSPHIGLVTYEPVSTELGELSQLLKVDLQLRRYADEHDVQEKVVALHEQGVDVVIGPSLVVETAERCGMAAVFLYSQESARQAVEEAIEAARVRAVERSRRQQLAALLGNLHEGVIAIDREERIWLANPAIGELLGQPSAALLGRPLGEVLPEAEAAGIFAPGAAPRLRKVLSVRGQRMIANLTPIDDDGIRNTAVLTLQDGGSIERAGRDLRIFARGSTLRARHSLADLVGESPAMHALRALAERFAGIDLSLLIHGESGTGKELIAQGIHAASHRRREPFVAINCAAMPENLLESELFGHEEGAFTGAVKGGKPGLLETAHRGTVFLDEVGDMPPALQVRLLRVLQEREVLRVGGREPIPIDIRVIAATHRDLAACVAAGSFRQDLFYRLNGLRLTVPSLRERREDLPRLVDILVGRRGERSGLTRPSPALLQRFLAMSAHYPWPGNVRELENMVERLMAVAGEAEHEPALLDLLFPELAPATETRTSSPTAPTLRHTVARAERAHLEAALREAGGNMQRAAQSLGISRTTLWRRLHTTR